MIGRHYSWTNSVINVVAVLLLVNAIIAVSVAAAPPPPPGPLGFTLDLHAGWNMISSPIRSVPVTSIQGDCAISNGPWWWSGTRYELTSTIEPAKGYWVKVGDPCTMQALTLTRHFPQTLALVPGWNMISSSISWNETNVGGCKLLSGPWWYDGTQYQQIDPNMPLDGFKGYWVKVDDNCIVTSQSVHGYRNDSQRPPLPPAEAQGLLANLLKLLGVPQRIATPQSTLMPLAQLQARLTLFAAGFAELRVHGSGITSSELRLFTLAGEPIADVYGASETLRFSLLAADGHPLANGVYLYLVIVRGSDGQMARSEVRKVRLLR